MTRLKIAITVALAVILQSSLRDLWPPFGHVDLPLILITYFALRRDAVQAVLIATVTGLGTDLLSVGLLGANGFSKTLTAYLIAAVVTRIMLDNPLLRIPVIAGAAAFDAIIYVLLHRLLGQPLLAPFAEIAAYKVIWTTVVGTVLFYVLERFFSEGATSQRRQFRFRRRVARRSLGRRRY